MSKILYVVPEGIDLGGIITSSENLMQGFREAGHEATFVHLRHGNARGAAPRGKHANEFTKGAGTGLLMHPIHGWRGSTFTTADPSSFIALAKQHDLVVWGALYGLRNDKTEGHSLWLTCITGHGKPQVFMVRDDHLEGRVPWAMAFAPYGSFAGVQQCSYDSLKGLGRRALVYSGHAGPHSRVLEHRRRNMALACATWKPWKRARTLLASAPYWRGVRLRLAGDGIELRYMRSPDKARERDYLPDGRKIWDAAVMDYIGPISERVRDELLLQSKFAIDLSLRDNSGQINRFVIEAMRHGAVPICDPRFLCGRKPSGDANVEASVFEPHVHFLPIAADGTPVQVAAAVNHWAKMPAAALAKIRENNVKLLPLFARDVAAAKLVRFGLGKGAASYDEEKLARGRAAFAAVFGRVKWGKNLNG